MLKFRPEWLGQSWSSILERWRTLRFRASIVGPHGSGKTTFLETIAPQLEIQGYDVQIVNCHSMDGQNLAIRRDSVVLLDIRGLNRERCLPRFASWNTRRRMQRRLTSCRGIIETRHYRGRYPVLLRTRTTPRMLAECIRELCEDKVFAMPEIERLFRKHRGNLRAALRECYDLLGSE